MITQLIQPEEVISLAFSPSDSVSPPFVRLARIELAQLKHIRPAFGDAMYLKMRTGGYDPFVAEYIKPAMAHYVRHRMILELAVRVGEYGVVRPSSQLSHQSSEATTIDLQKRDEDSSQQQTRIQAVLRETSGTANQNTTDSSNTANNTTDVFISETSETGQSTDTTNMQDVVRSLEGVMAPDAKGTVIKELSSADITSGTVGTATAASKDYEESKNANSSGTVHGTQSKATADTSSVADNLENIESANKEIATTTTNNSQNSGTGNTNRTNFAAATTAEYKSLARQALQDAHLFLRYAVDYVEANAELFPDYAPMSRVATTIGRRRCVGGVVL